MLGYIFTLDARYELAREATVEELKADLGNQGGSIAMKVKSSPVGLDCYDK